MARIKGVDLPNEKNIWIALTSIYGIGRNLSEDICTNAKVDKAKKSLEARCLEVFLSAALAGQMELEAGTLSGRLSFRSWSVMAQTQESDQTFSAVSIMSMTA